MTTACTLYFMATTVLPMVTSLCPTHHAYLPAPHGYLCILTPLCPEPHGYLSVSCTPWSPPVIFGLLVLCTLWSLSSVLNLIATSCTLHFMATSLHPMATTLHTMVTSLCPTPNGYQPVPCILWLTPRTWIPLGYLLYSFIHGHLRHLHYLATCTSGYVIPTHYVHLPASHGCNPATYLHPATLMKSLNPAPHGCQPASHGCHLAICLHSARLWLHP